MLPEAGVHEVGVPVATVVDCHESREIVACLSNVVIDTGSVGVVPWLAYSLCVLYTREIDSDWLLDRVSVHGHSSFLVFKRGEIPDHSRFVWLREFVREHQPMVVPSGRTRT